MDVLRMDQAGRIQVPEAVLRLLGLNATTQLRLEIQDGKIILVPLQIASTSADNEAIAPAPKTYYKGSVLVVEAAPNSDLEINQFIDDMREERIQEQMNL